MQNDAAARPSARAALRHEFLTNPAAQSNTYRYEVHCDGTNRGLVDGDDAGAWAQSDSDTGG
jgi:hypothetical protein